MATGENEASGSKLVQFNIRIHSEARRRLRIAAAESDQGIEEIVRMILYPVLDFSPDPSRPSTPTDPKTHPGSKSGNGAKPG